MYNWIKRNSANENNIIVAGDLNCCIREIDREPKTHLKDKSRQSLNSLLKKLNLSDAWSYTYPDQPGYTFFDKKSNCKSRLDYCLLSEDSRNKIGQIKLTKSIKGDHLTLMKI